MVTSIDDGRQDIAPTAAAPAAVSLPQEPPADLEPGADLYAEAELRLRHERTERFIAKASRDGS